MQVLRVNPKCRKEGINVSLIVAKGLTDTFYAAGGIFQSLRESPLTPNPRVPDQQFSAGGQEVFFSRTFLC